MQKRFKYHKSIGKIYQLWVKNDCMSRDSRAECDCNAGTLVSMNREYCFDGNTGFSAADLCGGDFVGQEPIPA